MIIAIACDIPILVPNQITIRQSTRFAVVTAIDSLPVAKFLGVNIGKRKVRHVQFAEGRLLLGLVLPIAQAKAKKSDLVAVARAALSFEMSGVIPPFGFEVGMRVMILGKSDLAAGQSQLIRESGSEPRTLTLPSPRTGEGKNQKGKNKEIKRDEPEPVIQSHDCSMFLTSAIRTV